MPAETMEAINIRQKFDQFDEHGSYKVVGEVNDFCLKLVKVKGEFIWHHHEEEDELFYVVKGRLQMKFRDKDVWVGEGEIIVVPRRVEHCPVAPEEVHLMLFERTTTINTGNVVNERTVTELERI